MIIGVLKEIKTEENRVSMTPSGVESLIRAGHRVLVEAGAGDGSGFADTLYQSVGAEIMIDPAALYAQADMVMRVKEPQPVEYGLIREGQILFNYFHFAAT